MNKLDTLEIKHITPNVTINNSSSYKKPLISYINWFASTFLISTDFLLYTP